MRLVKKELCTGCNACYSICPVHCISMQEDQEGFLYPAIEKEKCALCKKCETACPAIVQGNKRKPLHVFAAKNPNEEIRRQSSSGGIFTLIAESVIQKGGVVFGARFDDNWGVVHDYTETAEGLAAFRGSKYVQSRIGDTYLSAKDFLLAGRKVLFCGTPCQIAGLKAFLQEDYDNLLTVDLVCHGVPSPLVWKRYLDEVIAVPPPRKIGDKLITSINFREKTSGWKVFTLLILFKINISMNKEDITNINFRDKKKGKSDFTLETASADTGSTVFLRENLNQNTFFKGFLKNLFLRPSCYKCPVRSFKSQSDITIGDYWGIQNFIPEFDDDKGVSLVTINTEKGREIYKTLNKDDRETGYFQAIAGNPNIENSVPLPAKRSIFFTKLNNESVISLINGLTALSLWWRIRKKISILLSRLVCKK